MLANSIVLKHGLGRVRVQQGLIDVVDPVVEHHDVAGLEAERLETFKLLADGHHRCPVILDPVLVRHGAIEQGLKLAGYGQLVRHFRTVDRRAPEWSTWCSKWVGWNAVTRLPSLTWEYCPVKSPGIIRRVPSGNSHCLGCRNDSSMNSLEKYGAP